MAEKPSIKFRITIDIGTDHVTAAGDRNQFGVWIPRFFDRVDHFVRTLVIDDVIGVAVKRSNWK